MIRHTVPSDIQDRLDELSLLDHARGFPSIVIRESELLCRLVPSDRILIVPTEIVRNYSAEFVLLHGLPTVVDLFVVSREGSWYLHICAEHETWDHSNPWHSQVPAFQFFCHDSSMTASPVGLMISILSHHRQRNF